VAVFTTQSRNSRLSSPTGIRSPHGWTVTEKSLEAKNVAVFMTQSRNSRLFFPSLEAKNVAPFITHSRKRNSKLPFPTGYQKMLYL